MKVLVINPGISTGKKPFQRPGGIMAIAEKLISSGYDVDYHDLIGKKLTDRTLKGLVQEPYDYVLMSLMGGEFVSRGIKITETIKSHFPETIAVGGGPFVGNHLKQYPELTSTLPFDVYVEGEGEQSILDILQGQVDIKENTFVAGKPINVNKTTFPCEHLSPENYISKYDGYMPGINTFQITTARGCPYRCTMCHQNSGPGGFSYSALSPENMVAALEFLKTKYDIQGIYFVDDLLSIVPSRLHKFCELKLQSPIAKDMAFFGDLRSTDFSKDRVDAELLSRAGLKHVYVGFESGSDPILKKIEKDATVEDHEQAVRVIKKHGIRLTGSFVVGFPFEELVDLQRTIDFIKSSKLDYVEVHINGTSWNGIGKTTGQPQTIDELLKLSNWDYLPKDLHQKYPKAYNQIFRLRKRPGWELKSVGGLMMRSYLPWLKS